MTRSLRNHAEGKTAIITGGASGIGAALARALCEAGAEVVLADRQVELAEQLARQFRDGGKKATVAECDVRDLAALQRVVDTTVARTGRVDFFFNNAGIGVGGEMSDYSPRDWDDVIDVNLRGVAYGVQAVYPLMVRQKFGHIINTASMAGLVCTAGEASYGATKHAVVGLTKALRLEGKRHGVRASALCPGAIRTPILTGGRYGRLNYDGLTHENIMKMWEMVRPMDPDEFAQQALPAIFDDQAIIVLPRWWKALWYLERISLPASELVWRYALTRMRRDLEAGGARPFARNGVDAPRPVATL